jgi:hypothetical protein
VMVGMLFELGMTFPSPSDAFSWPSLEGNLT